MIRDMTGGSPARELFSFALPMILGNLLQQLYNIADLVVVGRFVGAGALAAVGASGSATFLFVALATGSAAGCTVVISQYFGAKRVGETKAAIYAALASMSGAGALLAAVGVLFGGNILRLMGTPGELFADAAAYLRIYAVAVLFLFLYNAVTAVFNALGDSRTPLCLLLFTSLANIGLDLLFVIRLGLGVSGAAWATLLSQAASAIAGLAVLRTRLRGFGAGERAVPPSGALFRNLWRVALPSMLQQSVVSMGFLFLQVLVNRYGPVVMAAYTAATRIDNIAILPMMNVGNALSAFTAQNVGACRPERVRRGVRAAHGLSLALGLSLTAVLFLFGRRLLGLFVDSQADRAVIEAGMGYLRSVSAFYCVMGLMSNYSSVLRGAGDMKVFLCSTVVNFSLRIAGAYLFAGLFGHGAIWWSLPLGWAAGLAISGVRYAGGGWRAKALVQHAGG